MASVVIKSVEKKYSDIEVLHGIDVSIDDGETEFTRVVGNTTGSHLSGAKDDPYGELERFIVPTRAFKTILLGHDLLKIDVEGHEANIVCSTSPTDWSNSDAILEVGSISNSERIFNHFKDSNINLFAQSLSWQKVSSLSDMPSSYKDGSLFISAKSGIANFTIASGVNSACTNSGTNLSFNKRFTGEI